jgi:hypothetical protein
VFPYTVSEVEMGARWKVNWLRLAAGLLLGIASIAGGGKAQAQGQADHAPLVVYPARHGVIPTLRDLPQARASSAHSSPAILQTLRRLPNKELPTASTDPVLQTQAGTSAAGLVQLESFAGISNVDNGVLVGGYPIPPDPNGAIGYDPASGKKYYVQWVNLVYAVWDVTGTPTLVSGFPKAGNSLFASLGSGSVCATTNRGDPIVLYDHLANRWFLSQFAFNYDYGTSSYLPPYAQCVAVSISGDPTGGYYVYEYDWPGLAGDGSQKFNDYTKFGIWPDAYYLSANQFTGSSLSTYAGAGVAALDRSALLSGQPLPRMVYFDLYAANPYFGGLLPADLDGPPPPAGAPDVFAEVDPGPTPASPGTISLWNFHVDWSNTANSTFGQSLQPNTVLQVAGFSYLPCVNAASSQCIPQPGTSQRVDALGDRLMFRLAYRNFGDHQALVVNHTVLADSTDRAGIRWYELDNSGSGWSVTQQSTYAPSDGLYRWMGSLAMDRRGDMALGYSISGPSAPDYPSINLTGRLAGDAPGQMTTPEITLAAGGGVQSDPTGRWGDYSSMSIDPQDDCTFWYTQEYYLAGSQRGWATQIGAFRFPGCPPALEVSPSIISSQIFQGQAKDISLTLTNPSSSPIAYTLSESQSINGAPPFDLPWLSESPASGNITGNTSQTVTLTLDATSLTAGSYTGYLQVIDTTNSESSIIPVTLQVLAPVYLPLIMR